MWTKNRIFTLMEILFWNWKYLFAFQFCGRWDTHRAVYEHNFPLEGFRAWESTKKEWVQVHTCLTPLAEKWAHRLICEQLIIAPFAHSSFEITISMIRRLTHSVLFIWLFLTAQYGVTKSASFDYPEDLREMIQEIYIPAPSANFEKKFVSLKDKINEVSATNAPDKQPYYRECEAMFDFILAIAWSSWR